MTHPAPGAAGLRVRVAREAAADLIPRFDGTTLQLASKAAAATPAGGGLLAGPVLLDLGEDGRLLGMSVMEERRAWSKGAVGWELPARATPHRLDVLAAPGRGPGAALATAVEVRWDAARRLCAVLFAGGDDDELAAGEGAARDRPAVVALGPRAYAAVDDGLLVGLLADLRGFDRAR